MNEIRVRTGKLVEVNKHQFTEKFLGDTPVVTFQDVDGVHHRPKGTASRNYRKNKKHFVENQDFYTINQPDEIRRLGLERPQGGVPMCVIVLTKQGYLMLVKSLNDDHAWDIQRQLVNKYFEKTEPTPVQESEQLSLAMPANQIAELFTNPDNVIAIATQWKNAVEEANRLREQNMEQAMQLCVAQPMIQFYKSVEGSVSYISVGELAKILSQNGIDIGRNRLYRELRETGYLMKDRNEPTQMSMNKGLFYIEKKVDRFGRIHVVTTTKVTPRGQLYFVNLFLNKYRKYHQLAI